MRFSLRVGFCVVVVLSVLPRASAAQDASYFVAGVATLSGDPSFIATSDGFAVSEYKPENGTAVNVFIGAQVRDGAGRSATC